MSFKRGGWGGDAEPAILDPMTQVMSKRVRDVDWRFLLLFLLLDLIYEGGLKGRWGGKGKGPKSEVVPMIHREREGRVKMGGRRSNLCI